MDKLIKSTRFQNGVFTFSEIEKGEYTLLAFADDNVDNEFAPTYYAQKLSLEAANMIMLYGHATEIDLQLQSKIKGLRKVDHVKVYPTVIGDNNLLTVHFVNAREMLNLNISDINGKIIFQRGFEESTRPEIHTVPIDILQSGIYYGRIYNNFEQISTFKVVK